MKRIKYYSVLLIIITTILFLHPKILSAQSIGKEEAREIAQKAQHLVNQRKWEDAIEILQNGIQNCGNEEQAKECRGILFFSLGYLYQQMSDVVPEERVNRLRLALELYQSALNNLPKSIPIMNNIAIVLQRLGEWQKAMEVLKRVIEIDKKKRDAYLIAIGDLYRENKFIQEAFDSYIQASELNPTNETSYWRILSLYRSLPEDKIEDLFRFSLKLRDIGQTELAREGLEQVINRSFKIKAPLAEKALIVWAEIGATQSWISEESLQSLPNENEWDSSAIAELKKMVIDPDAPTGTYNWWQKDILRGHVAAFVLQSVANYLLAIGNLELSAIAYDRALKIAPEFYYYDRQELKNKPPVALNISIEMASLYHKYPSLDRGERKFRRLEARLFGQKSMAYAERNLAAIQRFHTVLGLIYAEKGQWTSTRRADNAIFQLYHALDTAGRRVREDPKNYEPLPHLRSLLAKGYTEVRDKANAYKNYIDAAIEYLDLDSLKKAEELLETATNFTDVSPADWRRLEEVKNILDTRKQISILQRDNLNPQSPEYLEREKKNSWLFKPVDLLLDKSFVNRQRFKTFADLGNKASQLNAPQDALRFQTHALNLIKNENILTNMDDVIRLERIKNTVIQNVHLKQPEKMIGTGQNLEKNLTYNKGKIWRMRPASEPDSLQVGMDPDLLLAVTVLNRINREPSLASEPFKLQLQDGMVTILQEQSSFETVRRAGELIRNIEGVKKVKIKEERR